MKIITIGKGFISSHLPYEIANYRLFPSQDNISNFINTYKPDVIVNGIGYCGGGIQNATNTIDDCEYNKEKTIISNTVIPSLLATECYKLGIQLITIGSGCIFFGRSPNEIDNPILKYRIISGVDAKLDAGWKEANFANPKSFYSKTKYACDLAIENLPNTTILRIRMPISWKNSSRNFINKVKNYKQIIDIPNSVTFIDDLVRVVDWVIQNNKTGIYHTTNPEPLSAADVMREYQKYVPEHRFDIITEQELDKLTTSKRSNCILNTDKLTNEGFQMTPTKEALEKCMSRYFKELQ